MKTYHDPTSVHQPLAGYTHAIEITGPQRWLVLSGQIGMDSHGNLPGEPLEQLRLALGNIEHNLRAANMEVSDVVKLTMYIAGEMDTEERRLILSAWLNGHRPCMTLIYVAGLASPSLMMEIEALACTDVE